MRIGVAGAKGFIGSSVLEKLEARGDSVRALVRSGPVRAPGNVEIIQGDLMSRDDCVRFCEGLDVILHLAHTNSPIHSTGDPADDTLLNLVPTLHLLQAIRQGGRKPHVVYFSSGGAVYQSSTERRPSRETDPCFPKSSYGIQKLTIEHYLRIASERGDLTAIALRVGNAFGSLLPTHRMQGLIGVALSAVLADQPIRLFGSLENVRDYIHLDDISRLVHQVLVPRQPFSVINVGSGRGHSVQEVVDLIRDHYPGKVRVEHQPGIDTGGLPEWTVLDNSRAREEYGWNPTIDLRTGIARMIATARGTENFQSKSA